MTWYQTDPLLARAMPVLRSVESVQHPLYLAGGAVRDLLRGVRLHDLDFVTSGDVRQMARRTADALGGGFYPMDEERGTMRVVLAEEGGGRLFLDFSRMRANTLEADLRLRDFTINAMALPLGDEARLIDPTGGQTDLREKRLRACSENAMQDDPLRVLRGVRMALGLGLRVEAATLGWMRAAVPGLERVSGERRRDELFRLLEGSQVSSGLRLMDTLGALQAVLPELTALKGVSQSLPHQLDVWEHTLAVVQELEDVLAALAQDADQGSSANLMMGLAVTQLGRYRQRFAEHLAERVHMDRPMRALLFLAALYHDAGKAHTRSQGTDGLVHFYEHESQSARAWESCVRRLALSQAEAERVDTILRHHMRIHHLAAQPHDPSARAVYRFFRACGPAGVDVCLLTLADVRGTYRTTLTTDIWQREVSICRHLLEAWWEGPAEAVRPQRLVNGQDLIDLFGVPPGKRIGLALDAVLEAQACGEVSDRDAALDFVRRWLADHPQDAPSGGPLTWKN